MHLKPAESTLTKFKIKLKQREELLNQKVQKVQHQQQHGVEAESQEIRVPKIDVPKYIERQPSDLLK